MGPDWISTYVSPILVIIGTLVTAFATILLWRVTRTLAQETQRMADALARPQVVATLEPNRWAMNHADFHVENTGTATAYSIRITFDPPLTSIVASEPIHPIEELSVLKPGQHFRCYLSEFAPLLAVRFTVRVSWLREPAGSDREELSYALNMVEMAHVGQLGPVDPSVELADQVKKFREDWQHVASGWRRLKTDVYTSSDRLHEQRLQSRIRRRRKAAVQAQSEVTASPAAPQPEDR